ncbi:SUMF1/EgtB/PvdO family nonheme iron enzyme [Mastigocoleus testarum]|uniref:SUMF1/EgtB/PvdO family nonheme iron enzyme n=1 Tax=Mastigocoleus testarum TaxID=996925 RepID=UPI0004133DCB|nr:SUMF1/EgtB/PvdO family nonheme iron enzyme [Mastigocoleus testarum]
MHLTGSERERLCEAIISAYPRKPKLRMMVSYQLDKNLDAIAGGDDLTEIVFSLIEWAESRGKLENLIEAASKENPGNPDLREFQESIQEKYRPSGFSPASLPEITTFEFEVVTVDTQGRKTKRSSEQAEYFTEYLGDGVALEMVSIPGGKFQMGAPQDEKASQESERPQHMVNVEPFFMSRYPITQAQWKIVVNSSQIEERPLEFDDPSCFKGDNLPVERVSWYEAQEFCQRLSRKTGRIYRLPSEAQWEYACRAKETTPFHFGKTITTDLANYRGQDREINGHLYQGTYGGELPGVDRQRTTEVGSFPPNAFGLCDMHGLVWEWCADYEHENYQDAPSDGSVWLSDGNEEYRILRGGSWDSFPHLCRSASRFSESADVRDKEFGFRVVCSLM